MAANGDMPNDGCEDMCLEVSCGSSHSVALLSCNVVASWGRGEDGQLGHGDASQVNEPKVIYALVDKDISAVHCGAEYTIAVSEDQRTVYSWGWGDFGRLGHGDNNDVFIPQPISFFTGRKVREVACGDTHTCAVTDTGELFSFGRNQNGQLGLGHTNDVLAPQLVEALVGQPVISIACGSEHTIAATDSGQVFGWGWGRYGNLGDGQCQDRYTPTPVVGLEGIKIATVKCGWRHSVAVSDCGRIYTFGWSKYGQLGHGDYEDRHTPTLVESLRDKNIVLVAGGWRHTVAAEESGVLYAWGWNKFGQLGLGDTEDRNAPAVVTRLSGSRIRRLACGWRHTVAVTEDGQIYSWGRGVNGQLGHGPEEDVHEPKLLRSLCKGVLTRNAILQTSSGAVGSYVAPADRYAVVPDSEGPFGYQAFSSVPGSDTPSGKKARISQT